MKKSIFILYQGDDWATTVPGHTDAQEFGYTAWGTLCEKQGIDLLRGSLAWFKNGAFTKMWRFENGKWKKVAKKVKPNVIYDKCSLYDRKTGKLVTEVLEKKQEVEKYFTLVNDTEFTNLFDNKLYQSVIFHQYMPDSHLVQAGETVRKSGADPIVLKGFYGSGGKKVTISSALSVRADRKMLQQEFIHATHKGTLQDIRIVFVGEKPVYALTRIAKKRSLYTNFHQGARIEFLDLKKLKNVLAITKKIVVQLRPFQKKVFSLDFLIDSKKRKPLLVEINSMPGLDVFSPESAAYLKKYLVALTHYLLS
jgi:glutathione synthase/RimK-type ligase-like ATP-grasp enzyme